MEVDNLIEKNKMLSRIIEENEIKEKTLCKNLEEVKL